MTQQVPETTEEKIDHLLLRVQSLESHLINNIVKLQQQFTPDPDVRNLIIQLNDYTRHIKEMHREACYAYGKMNDLADKFRKECSPYGEIKFLNKRLHEIQESLKTMKQQLECVKKPAGPLSWIEELDLELKKVRPEEAREDTEYEAYEKRVMPVLSHLESLEKQMLLFRCKPTFSGHLTTYKLVCQEFNVTYDEARVICRNAIKKIDAKDLAKLNEYNFLVQYHQVTGKWINKVS